ncbi:MAG: anti-sigma factor [Bacteroidetes bacterium]|nr:anti-sigma factor [Bacteroidota bacterium]
MNVNEYIESGVLEAYVLGSLSAAEHARVQADIARYPELAEEVAAIEETMWMMAQAGAEEPPAALKEKIWSGLNAQTSFNAGNVETEFDTSSGKTIPFTPSRSYQLRWARAAIWIALIGSVLVNFILWSQRNNTMDAQLAFKAQLDAMQQQLAMLQSSARKQGDMLADSNMKTVVMQSMKPGHPMAATIYWNKGSGDAYLAMQKLPMPEKGKQYQMWVIKDGKPVSMGVIDSHLLENPTVSKLPMNVKDGQAFAISLEKEGGNPTPTEVYVLGKTS